MGQKFYVVWTGRQTGVFDDWPSARRAVEKFPGARFKSFESRAEAEQAFARGHASVSGETANRPAPDKTRRNTGNPNHLDVTVYCDGACEPNPGNAGSGIVVYRSADLAELWYGLYHPNGTNNTAELNALYHSLRMAEAEIQKGNTVQLCSDSAYSINSVRTWAPSWEKKGWMRSGGEIKNLQIIQDSYAIYQRIKRDLTLTHVAGHAGTEGNELADRMAMLAVQKKEKSLRRYEETMDVPTLLKMRAG